MSNHTPDTGKIVRRIRLRRDMTQEQLAEAAGLSTDAVKRIESGTRSGRPATLMAIAKALNVSTTQLQVPYPGASVTRTDNEPDGLMAVRRAINPPIGIDPPVPDEPVDAGEWAGSLRYVERLYDNDRYELVLDAIPGLIAEAGALHQAGDAEPLARAYHFTAHTLVQLRRLDLANNALEKLVRLADELSDELLIAWAVGTQTWAMLLQRRFDEVEKLAVTTAARIEPKMTDNAAKLASWAWLMTRASAAAIRDARVDDAAEYMGHARRAAVNLAEAPPFDRWAPAPIRTMCDTVIGYKTVENAVLAGDHGRALEIAGELPPSKLPTANNRHRHWLDLAAAHLAVGDQRAAVHQLLEIRDSAPTWMRHQSYARGVVQDLVESRRRALGEEVGELADHVGLPV